MAAVEDKHGARNEAGEIDVVQVPLLLCGRINRCGVERGGREALELLEEGICAAGNDAELDEVLAALQDLDDGLDMEALGGRKMRGEGESLAVEGGECATVDVLDETAAVDKPVRAAGAFLSADHAARVGLKRDAHSSALPALIARIGEVEDGLCMGGRDTDAFFGRLGSGSPDGTKTGTDGGLELDAFQLRDGGCPHGDCTRAKA